MPISISDKKKCCGCTACYAICPTNALQMRADEEGFQYPQVDATACIKCEKCVRVCPNLGTRISHDPLNLFAAKNRVEEVRNTSSSGGVFSLLAGYVERQNGSVYGAAFDKQFKVVHKRAVGREWVQFSQSKYVQSAIGDCFSQICEDLYQGRTVLFSGTPCQVAGLKQYLTQIKAPCDNLITLDIVCHGVPSPRAWQDWLMNLVGKSEIGNVNFRDKSESGWHQSTLTVQDCSGKVLCRDYQRDGLFFRMFFNHYILRPSCYACRYTNFQREGDFTLGDYWGIEKHFPEFDDNKGVSLTMVNTEKAKGIWLHLIEAVDSIPLKQEQCIQPNLQAPSSEPQNRKVFWEQYRKHGFLYAGKYVGIFPKSTADKIIIKLDRVLHHIFTSLHLVKEIQ